MLKAQLKPHFVRLAIAFGWTQEGVTSWGTVEYPSASATHAARYPPFSCSESPPEAFTAARVVQTCTHLWEPETAQLELNFREKGSSASLNSIGPREEIKCCRRKWREPSPCFHPAPHPAAGSWGCLLPREFWSGSVWLSGFFWQLLGLSL